MEYKGSKLVQIGPFDQLKQNMECFICIGGAEDPIILRPILPNEPGNVYREYNRVIKLLHRLGHLYVREVT